ncbi:hypothetical protein [Ramlibacter sp. PS4R-6]|uniref:hypothetical protein n=1 Tax=Ramlibacter sp. PS4R-6 TaxID=3133438 RepID=UPI0030A9C2DB
MAFSSAYDTLYRWARKTSTSLGDLRFLPSAVEEAACEGDTLVYRLRQWPNLPPVHRTAAVYKALSLMSNRPVSRNWFVRHSRMKAQQIDRLLNSLLAQGAVEVVDVSAFPKAA